MKRHDLTELHYLVPMENLSSILRHGILSHRRAIAHEHTSIANPSVQAQRNGKRIVASRDVHDYVNLYVNGRNAMLFAVLGFPERPPTEHLRCAVLSVGTDVLDVPNVVISDRNAAAGLARFYPPQRGLERLDRDTVFSRVWKDDNPIEEARKKEEMMAEVLVPERVDPRFLERAYVCCNDALQSARSLGLELDFEINRYIFFNDGVRYHD